MQTTENTLTPEQKMELAIARAKESRKRVRDEARAKLANNSKYVDYLASVEDEEEQITSLQTVMDRLNGMKAIQTNDGTKYNVNIYPVAEYVFGPVMSRVLGIVTGSSAMFTDERQAEFEAITGTSFLAVSTARNLIGSPAYYSKGVLTPEMPPMDIESISIALTAVCNSLNVDITYVNKVTKASLERWFSVARAKAEKQFEAFERVEKVDSENNFTLED